ncbi:glycosyltransferase [Pseudoclavibacter terrae]|uniref:glycosyltransferase n=1 Tax=Pseudoclavibacter terrae TaxID=1530195 RepID=UPI003A5C835B
MSADDFEREYRAADVVVTHAGVGTILSLLQDGIHPVVVPRRKERGEHVDNHQEQITTLVKELNVGTAVEADGDLLAALDRAARLRVINA